jgi:type VI secretion system protein ImpF
MAEIAPMERLQPCLLDRLTDDEPEVTRESRDQRVVSLRKYKSAVLRDIEMLFNSHRRPTDDNIYEFSEAARSVLNYGVPGMFGTTISDISKGELETQVKQAIQHFEPRISHRSLSVRTVPVAEEISTRALVFEIEGQLWARPAPEHLLIKTEVDLETGHCERKGSTSG